MNNVTGVTSEDIVDMLKPYQAYSERVPKNTPTSYVLVNKVDGGRDEKGNTATAVFELGILLRSSKVTQELEDRASAILTWLEGRAWEGRNASVEVVSFGAAPQGSTTTVYNAIVQVKTPYYG